MGQKNSMAEMFWDSFTCLIEQRHRSRGEDSYSNQISGLLCHVDWHCPLPEEAFCWTLATKNEESTQCG